MRRMLGLCSFAYATAHVVIYLHYDLGYDWQWAAEDIQERPFIVAGLSAFFILLLLAITSPNRMIKLLGKNWRRLHRLVYLAIMLALLHYWWIMKVGEWDPAIETALVGALLFYRIFSARGWLLKRAGDDGMEVSDRKSR